MPYIYYNSNPHGNHAIDCTVRAISLFTDKTWDETYLGICMQGFYDKNMPSADAVWGAYLENLGYEPHFVPHKCPNCTTVTPINVALTLGGVPIPSSLATITPAAVEQFNNITCSDIVKVPQCGYLQLAVESVADAADPTVTPAPVISVKNANLTIERIA